VSDIEKKLQIQFEKVSMVFRKQLREVSRIPESTPRKEAQRNSEYKSMKGTYNLQTLMIQLDRRANHSQTELSRSTSSHKSSKETG
jgi:hypothetical protein